MQDRKTGCYYSVKHRMNKCGAFKVFEKKNTVTMAMLRPIKVLCDLHSPYEDSLRNLTIDNFKTLQGNNCLDTMVCTTCIY